MRRNWVQSSSLPQVGGQPLLFTLLRWSKLNLSPSSGVEELQLTRVGKVLQQLHVDSQ